MFIMTRAQVFLSLNAFEARREAVPFAAWQPSSKTNTVYTCGYWEQRLPTYYLHR
jgi:hypothetical protein